MKRFVFERLSLFHFFIILSLFFSASTFAHPGHDHSKVVPFCGDLDLETCLQEKLNEAQIVFEGSVLQSKKYQNEKGQWLIEVVYEVHKIFKGNLINGRVTTINTVQEYKDYFSQFVPGMDLSDLDIYAPKVGWTGLVLSHEGKANLVGKLGQHENSKILTKDLVPFALTYDFGNDNSFPKDKKDYLLYENQHRKELSFKTTSKFYKFIESASGAKRKDFTKREFKKMTDLEWVDHLIKKNPEYEKAIWKAYHSKTDVLTTPVIDSYTPALPAGVESVFTVTGSNFDDAPGTIVWYTPDLDVDNGIAFDEFDMRTTGAQQGGLISWSSSTIEVKLPSMVYNLTANFGGTLFYKPRSLQSDYFRVKDIMGDLSAWTSATEIVNITYSIVQELEVVSDEEPTVINKRRSSLATFLTEGYMDYYVYPDVYNNCELMSQINEAMKIWKCASGIDWRVVEKTEDHAYAQNGYSTMTLITTGEDGQSIPLGDVCSNMHLEYNENDFQMSESPVTGSFLDVAMHEFGHSQGLLHTKPGPDGIKDLMHPGGTGPGSIQPDDLAGAIAMRDYSFLTTSCFEAMDYVEFGDYFMRDLAADVGNEPNCEAGPANDPEIYGSPDVWNCNTETADHCGGVNEQPLEGAENWMHARITNRSTSCDVYGGIVKFYWTIGSTGEDWSEDWIDDNQGSCLIGDYIGFEDIPSLAPGETTIVHKSWTAPIINDLIACDVYRYPWDVDNETYQVCLLARIESEKDYMFLEEEGVDIGENARNSNNIATKNTKLLDDPDLFVTPKPHKKGKYIGDVSWVIFHNNNDTPQPLDLTFTTSGEQVFDFQYVELLLSNELFKQVLESPYMEVQVTEPNVIRVAGNGKAVLPYIKMAAEEKQLIGIRLSVEEDKMEQYAESTKGASFYVQHKAATAEQDIRLSSRCTFFVPATRGGHGQYGSQEGRLNSDASMMPPTEILIYNVAGQFIRKMNILDNPYDQDFQDQLNDGVYLYVYRNEIGIVKTEKVVVIR